MSQSLRTFCLSKYFALNGFFSCSCKRGHSFSECKAALKAQTVCTPWIDRDVVVVCYVPIHWSGVCAECGAMFSFVSYVGVHRCWWFELVLVFLHYCILQSQVLLVGLLQPPALWC